MLMLIGHSRDNKMYQNLSLRTIIPDRDKEQMKIILQRILNQLRLTMMWIHQFQIQKKVNWDIKMLMMKLLQREKIAQTRKIKNNIRMVSIENHLKPIKMMKAVTSNSMTTKMNKLLMTHKLMMTKRTAEMMNKTLFQIQNHQLFQQMEHTSQRWTKQELKMKESNSCKVSYIFKIWISYLLIYRH